MDVSALRRRVPLAVLLFSAFDMERNGFYTLIDGRLLRVSQPVLPDWNNVECCGREQKCPTVAAARDARQRERGRACFVLLLQCPNVATLCCSIHGLISQASKVAPNTNRRRVV